ncbi:MAG: HAMP domain-containing protein, partial [Gemmatimonadota bacterium]|nr:HAMP domain-containing protein [Gemmatimonadota bacterium]
MAVLALLSYRHVKQQLYRQTENRLQQANVALSQAIFERLLLLDATLKSIPPQAIVQLDVSMRKPKRAPKPKPPVAPRPGNQTQTGDMDGRLAMGGIMLDRRPRAAPSRPAPSRAELIAASQALIAGLDLLARQRFVAVEFVGDDGQRLEIFGRLARRPKLTPRDSSDLRLGLPLIVTEHQADEPSRIYLMRRLVRRNELRGTFVGEASPEYLWGSLDQSMPSPTTRVAVLDDSAHVIFSSARAMPVLSAGPATTDPGAKVPRVVLDSADQSYLSASSEIRMTEAFASQPWRVMLSESKDEVLEPMVEFTNTFLMVVGLSSLVVLLLSVSQIRRSVLPLQELQKGTRRIAQRDFASRVTVTSRDEFEQLAASFNTMATQLGRQFNALATAAEIDRAVLSATDATTIVDTILARIRDVFPCSVVSVTVGLPDSSKSLTSVIQDYGSGLRHVARVGMRGQDVQSLLTGPDVLELRGGETIPTYLEPLVELGATSFVLLPLSYQRQLSGIIALGERFDLVPSEEDRMQMRRLADQAAVALANARMLDQVRELAYFDSLTGLPNR